VSGISKQFTENGNKEKAQKASGFILRL
jgi:hypothetical protein